MQHYLANDTYYLLHDAPNLRTGIAKQLIRLHKKKAYALSHQNQLLSAKHVKCLMQYRACCDQSIAAYKQCYRALLVLNKKHWECDFQDALQNIQTIDAPMALAIRPLKLIRFIIRISCYLPIAILLPGVLAGDHISYFISLLCTGLALALITPVQLYLNKLCNNVLFFSSF